MTEKDKNSELKLKEIEAFHAGREVDGANLQYAIDDTLHAFLGVQEVGTSNSGYWIDRFHKSVGLRPGYPWCMMFLQYVYKFVSDIFEMKDLIPFNTAGTKAFGNWATNKNLCRTRISDIKVGDILVWQNGSSDQGHVGAVISVTTTGGQVYTIKTIEGNTSSKDYRDGGQIAEKEYTYSQAELGAKKSKSRWLRCVVSFDALYAMATESGEVVK